MKTDTKITIGSFVFATIVVSIALFFCVGPFAIILLLGAAIVWVTQLCASEILGRIHGIPPRILRRNTTWSQFAKDEYNELREIRAKIVFIQFWVFLFAMGGLIFLAFYFAPPAS